MQKNDMMILTFFLEYFKDVAKLLIWVLWACPSKAITQKKLWCLSSKQKSNLISYIFYRYYTLKNSAIWLPKSISGNNFISKTCQTPGFLWKVKYQKNFYFALFLGKTNEKLFKKMQNTLFWGPFYPSLGKNFQQK